MAPGHVAPRALLLPAKTHWYISPTYKGAGTIMGARFRSSCGGGALNGKVFIESWADFLRIYKLSCAVVDVHQSSTSVR